MGSLEKYLLSEVKIDMDITKKIAMDVAAGTYNSTLRLLSPSSDL
jgi:hypothetical protein